MMRKEENFSPQALKVYYEEGVAKVKSFVEKNSIEELKRRGLI